MTEYELARQARQIEISGDFLRVYALNRGRDGVPGYYPPEGAVDAYKIGLDILFHRLGFEDVISADEVVTGEITLKQGFFDRFYAKLPVWAKRDNEQEIDDFAATDVVYSRRLEQFRRFDECGFEEFKGEYALYLKGGLLAIKVWKAWTQHYLNPPDEGDLHDERTQRFLNYFNELSGSSKDKIIEDLLARRKGLQDFLNQLIEEENGLLDRLRKTEVTFSEEDLRRLPFYKWLKEQGKIEG